MATTPPPSTAIKTVAAAAKAIAALQTRVDALEALNKPQPTPAPAPAPPVVVVKPTPTPAPAGYGFAEADATVGRVDTSTMRVLPIGNANDLRNALAANLSNTLIKLQDGDYLGYFEQTGAADNVKLLSESGKARLLNRDGSTNLLFQGAAVRSRVAIEGLRFQSDATGAGYPQLWWNELPAINGLELAHLDLTCPNGAFNALGCVQYSTASQRGNAAQNVWIHHNRLHQVGRCGMELLSQGYDGVFRLANLVIEDNAFEALGLGNEYGMAVSLSGLFKTIGLHRNTATGTRRIGYELVNTQQVVARGNNLLGSTDGVGYGFSDDGRGYTADIFVEGGTIDAAERPFYLYESNRIHLDGQGQLWKGKRGVDMGSTTGSTFRNLNLLVQNARVGNPETSWQWGSGTVGCTAVDCSVSSAGSAAAGLDPAFEALVLRSGATDNVLTNIATTVGRKADGTTYAMPDAGGLGQIIDQGQRNTITNNTAAVAP